MGKIILMMGVSLDGFIEGPDRDIEWHRVDEELHTYFNERTDAMGAFLSGRVTHQLMADYWPTADEDPAASAPMVEFARIWREKPKYVVSRTLARADWNTTILREVDVDEINSLKEQSDGDVALSGSDLAVSFRRLGLIDEYHICVHPVLIGRGKPLFQPTDATTDLRLTESRVFGNGVVLLRYAKA